MPGLFYSLETERPVPITLFFLEAVARITEEDPEQDACKVVTGALRRSKVSHRPNKAQVDYALSRLQEISNQIAANTHGESKTPDKGLGTDLLIWLSRLHTEEMCLLLSGFDSKKAREIYREWDRDEVTESFRIFLSYEREKIQASFEAALYGFGGGYKGSKGGPSEDSGSAGNVEVYDLTKHNPEGLEELKRALRGG